VYNILDILKIALQVGFILIPMKLFPYISKSPYSVPFEGCLMEL